MGGEREGRRGEVGRRGGDGGGAEVGGRRTRGATERE